MVSAYLLFVTGPSVFTGNGLHYGINVTDRISVIKTSHLPFDKPHQANACTDGCGIARSCDKLASA